MRDNRLVPLAAHKQHCPLRLCLHRLRSSSSAPRRTAACRTRFAYAEPAQRCTIPSRIIQPQRSRRLPFPSLAASHRAALDGANLDIEPRRLAASYLHRGRRLQRACAVLCSRTGHRASLFVHRAQEGSIRLGDPLPLELQWLFAVGRVSKDPSKPSQHCATSAGSSTASVRPAFEEARLCICIRDLVLVISLREARGSSPATRGRRTAEHDADTHVCFSGIFTIDIAFQRQTEAAARKRGAPAQRGLPVQPWVVRFWAQRGVCRCRERRGGVTATSGLANQARSLACRR